MSDLFEIDEIYDVSAQSAESGWSVFEIRWPLLEGFHRILKSFERYVENHELKEEWASFLGFYKRFRFFLTTTPLPPSLLFSELSKWKHAEFFPSEQLLNQGTESLKEHVSQLRNAFERIKHENKNYLWTAALEDIKARQYEDDWIALVCSETKLLGVIERFLKNEVAENVWVLRAAEMKAAYTYSQLMLFGPTSKFIWDRNDYLFKSPKAIALTLFTPDFFPAQIPTPYDLLGSPHKSNPDNSVRRFNDPTIVNNNNAAIDDSLVRNPNEEEWVEALPKFHLNYVPRACADSHDDVVAEVSARQAFLTADHLIYLHDEGRVNRLRVDYETKRCLDIEIGKSSSVSVGDILIFSAEGGGDKIIEEADRLLGEDALHLRKFQRLWKKELGKVIATRGMDFTQKALGASAQNIKNWCSMTNIGPSKQETMAAITRCCGINDQLDRIIEATKKIRMAHIRAGFELSRRLRSQLKGQSLKQLFEEGFQRFGGTTDLPTTKVVFEVIGFSNEVFQVQPSDLLEPIEIVQQSWR